MKTMFHESRIPSDIKRTETVKSRIKQSGTLPLSFTLPLFHGFLQLYTLFDIVFVDDVLATNLVGVGANSGVRSTKTFSDRISRACHGRSRRIVTEASTKVNTNKVPREITLAKTSKT